MPSDHGPDIRALLEREAELAPRPIGMRRNNLRRARLQRIAVISASIVGIMSVVVAMGFAGTWLAQRAPLNPASGGWIPLTTVEQLREEGVVYDATHGVFAVWDEGQPLVLSERVPHIEAQNERALFCTTSQTFDGPHGEKFDRRGYYYGGPAQHGLDRYASRIEGGFVDFHPDQLTEGPPRGAGPAMEPQGRFCTEDHTEREPGFAAATDGNPSLESDFAFLPYPGNRWYGPDGPIDSTDGIINVIRGPEHCDWQSAAMLHVSWPLGTPHQEDPTTYQFLRDPENVFRRESLLSEFDGDATLFGGATYTGYHTDFMELWLMPNDDTGSFLMFSDHVEWWPRAREVIACA